MYCTYPLHKNVCITARHKFMSGSSENFSLWARRRTSGNSVDHREHASNVIENKIAALKMRYKFLLTKCNPILPIIGQRKVVC